MSLSQSPDVGTPLQLVASTTGLARPLRLDQARLFFRGSRATEVRLLDEPARVGFVGPARPARSSR